MMDHTKFLRQSKRSAELFSEARKVIPSGSSSLIRVAGHEPYPLFMQKGKGSHIWDVDGNGFIDLLMSYGVLINGHAHPRIMEALRKQLEDGTIFGTPTELELKTAKKFKEMVPSDMVLFCNSGTEATMHAIRMARAVTGKDRIVKFEGAYHGQHDYVMFGVEPSETGLEIKPYSVPYDPGIPDEISRTVVLAPWNNPQVLERIMKRYRNDIAAIITEPIMANCGVILPNPDYLHQLKEIAERFEALLIFDEVVTGFRVSMGGAQEYYGVEADLCTYGKALGGGVPIAAIAGKKEVLEMVSPGKMVFGGTYNANPLSLAGTYANLEILSENGGAIYGNMHRIGTKLMKGLEEEAQKAKVEVLVQGVGSVYQVFFTYLHEIQNYREALNTNDEKFQTFQQGMLNRGVYIHPDPFERQLISTVHTDEDVEKILQAASESFVEVREKFE
ncbi:MAG TPA: aspartate aminotransferase family protein [Nitrososphaerales archaeon]|nr:aspartate aminotransferase family protein [Nitrososphaerales archaeon]